jgi:hypothetical protein
MTDYSGLLDEGRVKQGRFSRKRNRATYDMVGTVSRDEATEGLDTAREFVDVLSAFLTP